MRDACLQEDLDHRQLHATSVFWAMQRRVLRPWRGIAPHGWGRRVLGPAGATLAPVHHPSVSACAFPTPVHSKDELNECCHWLPTGISCSSRMAWPPGRRPAACSRGRGGYLSWRRSSVPPASQPWQRLRGRHWPQPQIRPLRLYGERRRNWGERMMPPYTLHPHVQCGDQSMPASRRADAVCHFPVVQQGSGSLA